MVCMPAVRTLGRADGIKTNSPVSEAAAAAKTAVVYRKPPRVRCWRETALMLEAQSRRSHVHRRAAVDRSTAIAKCGCCWASRLHHGARAALSLAHHHTASCISSAYPTSSPRLASLSSQVHADTDTKTAWSRAALARRLSDEIFSAEVSSDDPLGGQPHGATYGRSRGGRRCRHMLDVA
jgi:hypothetical protein